MTESSSRLGARAREIGLTITSWPSVTGTAGEAAFAHKLARLLSDFPYFRDHPEDLIVQPVEGGTHQRSNVLALVRGKGSRTIVLAGHFDVVPVDDYGDLAELAFSPEALRPKLVERLERMDGFALALEDLRSGRFLPGRGLLDMKSGLAAGIALLEQFAADPERNGNLLLVATPDEEDRSAGMLAAAATLPTFLRERELEVPLGINLDAVCDNADGADGRIAALGCIGKLLLSALVVGKESHACYPMDGINAAYLAAELVAEMEFAPELGEQSGAEFASAPTSLGMRDLKSVYNVTTPGRVWTFWNILTQRRTAAEVLRIAHEIAERAVARSRQRIEERAVRAPGGVPPNGAWSRLSVIGFAELHARAVARDPGFAQRFKARATELARADDLDFPTRSQILTELAWEGAGGEDPAIVLGFASMPYPAVNWPISGSADTLREVILDGLRLTSEQTGVDISTRYHLPVIVDMSFLGPVEVDDLTAVADATPIWGSSIRWSMNEPTPAIPMVNIGPWGRDYHHWLERVEEHYAFEVLPHLLANVTQGVLASRMG